MKCSIAISVLIVLVVVIIFSSCQKELTCYGAECPGVSVYSFVQDNGTCTNALVKGIYMQETKLTDSNTVAVKVDVTKKGAYTINSDTLNGFYFKGEGEFANTGMLTVLLNGIGKPAAAGNYTFTSSKTSGCSFAISVDTIPYVEKYFYEFTLDGRRYTDTVRGGVRISNFEDTSSQRPMWSGIGFGREITTQTGWRQDDGILIGKHSIPSSLLNLTGMKTYFAPGNYNYLLRFSSSNGVLVGWLDLNDPAYYWVSSIDVQPATSNFTITSVETYADSQGRPIAKVKAIFNCILYNGVGQSKELTNGKFYGEFANINR